MTTLTEEQIKRYRNPALLSVIKAWRYSAPGREMEKDLDLIIQTVEIEKSREGISRIS